MKRPIHVVLASCLCALGMGLSQSSVQAQYYNNPYGVQPFGVPGVGNPYSPVSGGYANPYTPTPGTGVNPYQPSLNPTNPYSYGAGNPYYMDPGFGYGATLTGSADVMRSYGQVVVSQENARILREQYNQAKIQTRKQEFDLNMYIKANTPTYTQEQERIAKSTLRRIQTLSLPGEISNGKSLNYLLNDLRKYPAKKIALEPLRLSENVLTHLNVTKNQFGIGLLRDGGRVTWPNVLQEQMSAAKRQELDKQLKALVEDAYRGKLDVNVLKDVSNEIEKLRAVLLTKVNEIPFGPYTDAKRFLSEFDDSLTALGRREAQVQGQFQRFIEGGRSIQDVVGYMIENGLNFGPATAADEPAYRAVHSMLTTYDIAMNTALGIDIKE